MALTNEEVYYLSPDRKTSDAVTEDLKKPNGITGTPDGKKLFVADMGAEPDLALRHPARTAR
jgi:gluconolactonase